MLRNIEFLQGSTVKASDGDVGTVTQVFTLMTKSGAFAIWWLKPATGSGDRQWC